MAGVVRLELGNIEFSGGEFWPSQRHSAGSSCSSNANGLCGSGLRPNQLELLRITNT
jgi:hypothetical protein